MSEVVVPDAPSQLTPPAPFPPQHHPLQAPHRERHGRQRVLHPRRPVPGGRAARVRQLPQLLEPVADGSRRPGAGAVRGAGRGPPPGGLPQEHAERGVPQHPAGPAADGGARGQAAAQGGGGDEEDQEPAQARSGRRRFQDRLLGRRRRGGRRLRGRALGARDGRGEGPGAPPKAVQGRRQALPRRVQRGRGGRRRGRPRHQKAQGRAGPPRPQGVCAARRRRCRRNHRRRPPRPTAAR